MNNLNPSRSLTLQDVLDAIDAAPLSRRDRSEMKSSVHTTCRIFDAHPRDVRADPRGLSLRLTETAAVRIGVSKRRLSNVRSFLRRALKLARPILPGRIRAPMSLAWQKHYEALPRHARHSLSRSFRWFSMRQINPENVTLADIEQFRETLFSDALIKDVEATWRLLARKWNTARRKISGWPDIEIAQPASDFRYVLPWSAFPASLERDATAYLNRLSGSDPFEPLPFKPVCANTRAKRGWQIRSFASAVVLSGAPASDLQTLADLIEINRLKHGLLYLMARKNGSSSKGIYSLSFCLLAIARHWIKLEPDELDVLRAVLRRVKITENGMTAKNSERLRPFDDEETVRAFLNLADRLVELSHKERRPKAAAHLFQTAVAIELLQMRPIRLDNLRTLTVGVHVHLDPQKKGRVNIVLDQTTVKNKVGHDYSLPERSVRMLRSYLTKHHGSLSRPGNNALFPGRNGKDFKSKGAFRSQIAKAIALRLGLDIHPHLFRHIGAKLYLDARPGEYEVMRRVLGHKRLETTTRAYCGAETKRAVERFDKTIESLRAQSTSRGKGRRP